jgi:hypothetical protein
MKHNTFIKGVFILAVGCCLTGCGKDDKGKDEGKTLTAINVNPASLSMPVGGKQSITATPEPADVKATFTWTSAHPSIAAVSPTGEVTGVAEGTTAITVSCGNINATVTVEVIVGPETLELKTPDNGIEIDANSSTGFPVEFTWGTVAAETGGYILKVSIDANIPDDEEKTTEIVVDNTTGAFELTKAMAEIMFVNLPRFTTLYWTVVPKTESASVATQIRTVKAARKLNIAGQWKFEDGGANGKDLTALGTATVGNNLVITENNTILPDGWQDDPIDIYAIDGPSSTNGAIRKGKGGVMEWTLAPGFTPKPGEQRINEYSMVFDIRKSTDGWRSFGQWYNESDPGNQSDAAVKASDGELFVHATRVGSGELGYSAGPGVVNNIWHRVIFSMNLGVQVNYYIDGARQTECGAGSPGDGITIRSTKDGRWSLPSKVWFFQDGVTAPETTLEHEDWVLDVAEITVYKEALTDAEVFHIGMFGQTINN